VKIEKIKRLKRNKYFCTLFYLFVYFSPLVPFILRLCWFKWLPACAMLNFVPNPGWTQYRNCKRKRKENGRKRWPDHATERLLYLAAASR